MSNAVLNIDRPDSTELSAEASPYLALVESMAIDSDVMYEAGADELRAIKAKSAALEDRRKRIKAPILQAGKEVDELFREPIDLLTKAESILKGKLIAFADERERIAREQQEARDRAAAEERDRLAREAEEARQVAAEQRQAAEAAAAAGDTKTAAIASVNAEQAEQRAEMKADVASLVVAAPVVVDVPKARGISTRKEIDFAVESVLKIAAWVVEHPEDVALLRVDEVKLRARVKSQGLACNVPGVRVFEKKGIAATRKG